MSSPPSTPSPHTRGRTQGGALQAAEGLGRVDLTPRAALGALGRCTSFSSCVVKTGPGSAAAAVPLFLPPPVAFFAATHAGSHDAQTPPPLGLWGEDGVRPHCSRIRFLGQQARLLQPTPMSSFRNGGRAAGGTRADCLRVAWAMPPNSKPRVFLTLPPPMHALRPKESRPANLGRGPNPCCVVAMGLIDLNG